MSLVRAAPVSLARDRALRRTSLRASSFLPAGMTRASWQVTARGLVTFGEALEMDVAYVRGWSLTAGHQHCSLGDPSAGSFAVRGLRDEHSARSPRKASTSRTHAHTRITRARCGRRHRAPGGQVSSVTSTVICHRPQHRLRSRDGPSRATKASASAGRGSWRRDH